mmetsp:Transcript_6501/g.16761  ORF Transcript_6501/g.16761 Transcript_6501/m.16761 type:complete len:81 (-) Transcript_6501:304-546(-)
MLLKSPSMQTWLHDVKYGWYFKPNFIKRVAENCEQKRTGARCEGVWRKAVLSDVSLLIKGVCRGSEEDFKATAVRLTSAM